jgi:anaphase-promoting complex subunit 2
MCNCQELVSAFTRTNQYLTDMGILDRIAGYSLTMLIQDKISCYVQDTCKGSFDTSHIAGLEKWLNTIVLQWLVRIFNKGSLKLDDKNSKIAEAVKNFQIKLNYFLYEEYANTIIDQFFNIIIGEEVYEGDS